MADPIATRRVNRARNVELLERAGFRPAPWLPLREHRATLRPTIEIVSRLMAMAAIVAWIEGDEILMPTRAVQDHVTRSRLDLALVDGERDLLETPRARAVELGAPVLGSLVDASWSLSWILGLDLAPGFDGRAIPADIRHAVLAFATRGLDATSEAFVTRALSRPVSEVVVVEDLFYCAHNAARRAAFGEPVARPGFDPVEDGERIESRRLALTWSLAPGVEWEETELDT